MSGPPPELEEGRPPAGVPGMLRTWTQALPDCRRCSPTASDEAGIFAQVAGHAAADHGVTDITPEMVRAVRDRIVAV